MIKLRLIILAFLVLSCLLMAWAWRGYHDALNDVVVTKKGLFVEISKGDSFNKITQNLRDQQIKVDPLWFKFIAYQKKITNKLKAGDYELHQGMTIPDLLSLFVSGKSRQYSITFPEGWTIRQILQSLLENPYLKHTLKDVDYQTILSRIGANYDHPEGLFFPETYFFEKNNTDISVLKRAYDKMQHVLQQEWLQKQENLPLENAYQALILASIVEKETGVASERHLIAGVFTRRLQKGMLLQTDPTVIYGMGNSYKGNIRRKDLKKPTPYNTYVIKGLPPTPIAMPGREAIHAVLHPAEGNTLYFVARGDGSHEFSASLRAHNNAVNKYQRLIR